MKSAKMTLNFLLQSKNQLFICVVFCVVFAFCMTSQHQPKNFIVGAHIISQFKELSQIGGDVQFHYSQNCYSSYISELSFVNIKDKLQTELGISVNSILFNFNKFTITGGLGFVINNAELTKKKQNNALFLFSNGKTNLGALLKIRALFPVNKWWQFSGNFNFKSIGNQFTTLTFGIIYEIPTNIF